MVNLGRQSSAPIRLQGVPDCAACSQRSCHRLASHPHLNCSEKSSSCPATPNQQDHFGGGVVEALMHPDIDGHRHATLSKLVRSIFEIADLTRHAHVSALARGRERSPVHRWVQGIRPFSAKGRGHGIWKVGCSLIWTSETGVLPHRPSFGTNLLQEPSCRTTCEHHADQVARSRGGRALEGSDFGESPGRFKRFELPRKSTLRGSEQPLALSRSVCLVLMFSKSPLVEIGRRALLRRRHTRTRNSMAPSVPGCRWTKASTTSRLSDSVLRPCRTRPACGGGPCFARHVVAGRQLVCDSVVGACVKCM